jgi:hypothetical protein
MKVLSAAKANMGIVAGGVAGYFLSGILVNAVESAAASVLGTGGGAKWARAASGGVVALGSFYAATRMRKPDIMVAFGAVALGYAIQGAMSAFGVSSSS